MIYKWQSEMPGFDRDFYLKSNPDVAASGTNPLNHYLEYGWREGREPSAGFTGKQYLSLNPDVQMSGENPLVHFLNFGIAEGRTGACIYEAESVIKVSSTVSRQTRGSTGFSLASRRSGPARLL
jgi:hypothetical protein